MKILEILFTVIVSVNLAHSQSKDVKYSFDEEVNGRIKEYLQERLKSDSSLNFYLYLTTSSLPQKRGNYVLFINHYDINSTDFINDIVFNSNRYYIFGEIKIPIVFDYDFKFIGYGSGNRGIKRKAYTGSAYFIEFNSKGRFIKDGY